MKQLTFYFFALFSIFCNKSFCQESFNNKSNLKYLHLMPKAKVDADKQGFTFEIKFTADECFHIYSFATRIEVRKQTSSDKKVVNSVISKLNPDADVFEILDIVKLNEKIVIIVNCKSQKRNFILAYEIDRKSCKIKSEHTLLYELIDDLSASFKHEIVKSEFNDKKSDRLVIQTIKTIRSKGFEIYLRIYNADLKTVFDKKINFPKLTDSFMLEGLFFEDENNFIYSAVTFPESTMRRQKKQGKPNYTHHVFYFSNLADKVDDFVVKIDGFFITDFIAILNNNNIVVSGFYSNESDFQLKGSFYQKVAFNNFSVLESVTNEIDNEMLISLKNHRKQRKLLLDREESNYNIENPEFNLSWLSVSKDGSVYLVAEDIYSSEIRVSPSSMDGDLVVPITMFKIKNHHIGNLIVLKISSDDKTKWSSKIDKENTIHEDIWKYSFFCNSKDELNFIFNGSLKDFDGKVEKNVTGNSAPIIVNFSISGKQSKEILKVPENNKSLKFFPESFKIMNDEVIFKLADVRNTGYYSLKL